MTEPLRVEIMEPGGRTVSAVVPAVPDEQVEVAKPHLERLVEFVMESEGVHREAAVELVSALLIERYLYAPIYEAEALRRGVLAL